MGGDFEFLTRYAPPIEKEEGKRGSFLSDFDTDSA
jgi:hypothetical protein